MTAPFVSTVAICCLMAALAGACADDGERDAAEDASTPAQSSPSNANAVRDATALDPAFLQFTPLAIDHPAYVSVERDVNSGQIYVLVEPPPAPVMQQRVLENTAVQAAREVWEQLPGRFDVLVVRGGGDFRIGNEFDDWVFTYEELEGRFGPRDALDSASQPGDGATAGRWRPGRCMVERGPGGQRLCADAPELLEWHRWFPTLVEHCGGEGLTGPVGQHVLVSGNVTTVAYSTISLTTWGSDFGSVRLELRPGADRAQVTCDSQAPGRRSEMLPIPPDT